MGPVIIITAPGTVAARDSFGCWGELAEGLPADMVKFPSLAAPKLKLAFCQNPRGWKGS